MSAIDFSLDSSSELGSPLSRTPSPPPEMGRIYLPTPPFSGHESTASPAPDGSFSCASSPEEDSQPPLKRRRLTPTMPRKTERLDLHNYCEKPREQQSESDIERSYQLNRLLTAIRKKRKIVVIAGAGISVSAGIPDFRSSTGLFKSLRSQHNLKSSGKHLFDAAVYRDAPSTSSFHDMIRTLHTSTKSAKPTEFHHLLARLAREDRLLRLYTQNVDGIDTSLPPLATQVPLPLKGPWNKTVQVHGGLDKMICTKCNTLSDFRPELFDGPIPPDCAACRELDHVRTTVAGKRSHGIGRLRPRMVLYNEHNPDSDAIGAVASADLRTRPDAVLVVGTSLKVPGVRRIVREMCASVRDRRDGFTAWINTDPEPSGKEFSDCWDLVVTGTSDEVAELAGLRRYDDDDIGDVKEVTEEEVKLVLSRGTPSVVVNVVAKSSPPVSPQKLVKTELVERTRVEFPKPPAPKTPPKRRAAPKAKAKTASGAASDAPKGNGKIRFKTTKPGMTSIIVLK